MLDFDRLRIFRTWTWEPVNEGMHAMIGGKARFALRHHDQLQFLNRHGLWQPIEVVEAEKPEHPARKAEREENERWAKELAEAMAKGANR